VTRHRDSPPTGHARSPGGIPRLLTIAETAKALRICERGVRGLIAERILPVVRVGSRAVRVHPEDLERFIDERRGRLGS
jgi:excisionase family DNA binding protein